MTSWRAESCTYIYIMSVCVCLCLCLCVYFLHSYLLIHSLLRTQILTLSYNRRNQQLCYYQFFAASASSYSSYDALKLANGNTADSKVIGGGRHNNAHTVPFVSTGLLPEEWLGPQCNRVDFSPQVELNSTSNLAGACVCM